MGFLGSIRYIENCIREPVGPYTGVPPRPRSTPFRCIDAAMPPAWWKTVAGCRHKLSSLCSKEGFVTGHPISRGKGRRDLSRSHSKKGSLPWEPTTLIFRGCNPYFGGVKPSFFMALGSKGGRCLNKYMFIFTPKIGEDEPILTLIFLGMGWFNHQLVVIVKGIRIPNMAETSRLRIKNKLPFDPSE